MRPRSFYSTETPDLLLASKFLPRRPNSAETLQANNNVTPSLTFVKSMHPTQEHKIALRTSLFDRLDFPETWA
jgi:hypothetical protein